MFPRRLTIQSRGLNHEIGTVGCMKRLRVSRLGYEACYRLTTECSERCCACVKIPVLALAKCPTWSEDSVSCARRIAEIALKPLLTYEAMISTLKQESLFVQSILISISVIGDWV